jgi:uncharacterized membrane protein
VFRIAQFLYNRSLTEGEAALALNIANRSYTELLQPLDHAQAAPAGFLVIQRFFVALFSNTEMAMRILPLLAGIASLFLFYAVAKRILKSSALTFSLILIAAGDHLIYFASEVKQYSTDVFWALCIIILTLWLMEHRRRLLPVIIFSLVSALSLWFSHPAVFVYAGCILVILIPLVIKKSWKELAFLLMIILIPIISFALHYLFILKAAAGNQQLIDFWQSAFMPLPPTSVKELAWFPYVFLRTFKFPIGFSVYTLGLAVISFLFGCLSMLRTQKRLLALMMFPVLFTLVASGLHKYPFEGRLILFLTPLFIIIIAEGLDFLREGIARYHFPSSMVMVLVLLFYPVGNSLYRLIKPRAPEELRPVMKYVAEQKRSSDVIYLYYASVHAYRYYAPRLGFDPNIKPGIEARDNWTLYFNDIDTYRDKDRVWFLFSHIATTHHVDEEELFLSYLDKIGTQIDQFSAPGASAYLYDLTLMKGQYINQ